MERRKITPQEWLILKSRTCDKQKHRLRTNKFGVTWCVICGLLSNTDNADELKNGDGLLISSK